MRISRSFTQCVQIPSTQKCFEKFWEIALKDIRQQKSIGSTRLEYELNVCSQEVIHITPVFEISFSFAIKSRIFTFSCFVRVMMLNIHVSLRGVLNVFYILYHYLTTFKEVET